MVDGKKLDRKRSLQDKQIFTENSFGLNQKYDKLMKPETPKINVPAPQVSQKGSGSQYMAVNY